MWNSLEPPYGSKSSPNTLRNTESTCDGSRVKEARNQQHRFMRWHLYSGQAGKLNKICCRIGQIRLVGSFPSNVSPRWFLSSHLEQVELGAIRVEILMSGSGAKTGSSVL